jgi:hypothetical protein
LGESTTPVAAEHLRRLIFWSVLILAAAALGLGYLLESELSYRIGMDSQAIRHGSYGFTLATYAPVEPGRRTVVLLGNSVYQACEIIPRMQKMADERQLNLRLVNLAQTGAGINDHLVQAAEVLRHPPDLLVVSMIPSTFDRALPPFRTDANLMALDRGPLRHLPRTFYASQFNHKTMADSAISALVPYPRLDPILRSRTNLQSQAPAWLLARLGFPTLNLAADWLGSPTLARPEGFPSGKSYPGSGDRIHELVTMARTARVPLLMIWQEYQSAEPDLLPALQAEAAADARPVTVVDLHHFWQAGDYSDSVHPVEAYRDVYAARHLEAVLKALPPSPPGAAQP